jgi:hypothetical protein
MDAQPHVQLSAVTRPVTRPTVTVLLVECNNARREREHKDA